MPLFRSEQGIGRGEVAESRLELPIFGLFLAICALALLAQHLVIGIQQLTIALAASLLVFGVTIVKVDYGVYILVIAMLLSPEIEAGNKYSGERTLNIRYDDILILVIFLGVMVKLTLEGRLRLWQPNPINSGIVAYYSVCIVATLLALERGLAAWDVRSAIFVMLKMLEYYLIFFLVSHAIRDKKSIQNQLTLFFIVSIIVSIYAATFVGSTERVSSPFEKGGTEPNTLGGYLVIVMCLALALSTQAPTARQKFAFLVIVLCCFFPFLHTLSRASYIALIVGITTIGIISRKFVLLISLVIILGSSIFIMPEKVISRVTNTFQEDSGQDVVVAGTDLGFKVDKSTYERFLVWRKVGYLLSLGGLIPYFGGGVSWETVLDSQYARVILETGIFGLLAFLFMQWRILRTTREAYRWTNSWMARGLAMGMFATTVALIAHSVGTISFLIVRIMEPFWFLIALCVSTRSQAIMQHTALAKQRRIQAEEKFARKEASQNAIPVKA